MLKRLYYNLYISSLYLHKHALAHDIIIDSVLSLWKQKKTISQKTFELKSHYPSSNLEKRIQSILQTPRPLHSCNSFGCASKSLVDIAVVPLKNMLTLNIHAIWVIEI